MDGMITILLAVAAIAVCLAGTYAAGTIGLLAVITVGLLTLIAVDPGNLGGRK